MKTFAAGVVVTLVCIIGGVYAYFAGGFAPVATASVPMPFERNLANMALHAKVQKEMPKTVPIEANEANYLAGAHEYLTNCAVCHGVPGKEKTVIARAEFPIPPKLLEGERRHRRFARRDILEGGVWNSADGNAGFQSEPVRDPDVADLADAGECGQASQFGHRGVSGTTRDAQAGTSGRSRPPNCNEVVSR